jgi:hypothetical protein
MNKDYVLTRHVAADYPHHLPRVSTCAHLGPPGGEPAAWLDSSLAGQAKIGQPQHPPRLIKLRRLRHLCRWASCLAGSPAG